MSGSDGVFNSGLGKFAAWAELPASTADALIVTFILTANYEGDAALKDSDDLTEVYDGNNNEPATSGGYARKVVNSGITHTPDHANDRVDVDFGDQTYTALAASHGQIAKTVISYDADTSTGTDTDIRCGTYHNTDITPDDTDVVLSITNIFRASM